MDKRLDLADHFFIFAFYGVASLHQKVQHFVVIVHQIDSGDLRIVHVLVPTNARVLGQLIQMGNYELGKHFSSRLLLVARLV